MNRFICKLIEITSIVICYKLNSTNLYTYLGDSLFVNYLYSKTFQSETRTRLISAAYIPDCFTTGTQ